MADVVTASVSAYSDHLQAYAEDNAHAVADLVTDFAGRLQPGSRVLDAGCGPGRDLRRFVAAGMDPIGVDLNAGFVAAARRYGPVLQSDLRDLPFADASFDAVWACASLVHLPPAQASLALTELARVTRPGGLVYASVKIAGTTGFTPTAHGTRYFEVWQASDFVAAVAAAGMTPTRTENSPVFVNVWATR